MGGSDGDVQKNASLSRLLDREIRYTIRREWNSDVRDRWEVDVHRTGRRDVMSMASG